MLIPEQHQRTIRALVEADPEVAQATCDIPHLAPDIYLAEGDEDDALPYCGCFVGVYAWMKTCKRGYEVDPGDSMPALASGVCVDVNDIIRFGGWCNTMSKDRLAVRYARSLLA